MTIKHLAAKAKYYGLLNEGKRVEWRNHADETWHAFEPAWDAIREYQIREAPRMVQIGPIPEPLPHGVYGEHRYLLHFKTEADRDAFIDAMKSGRAV